MNTVLLVEDNKVNQMVAVKLLKKAGYSVETVDSGPDALSHLENHQYNVILMDYHMPGMNGAEVTKEIRDRDINTPIIAVTASVDNSMERDCIAAGMNDFLAKPIILDELKQKIEKWLEQPLSQSA